MQNDRHTTILIAAGITMVGLGAAIAASGDLLLGGSMMLVGAYTFMLSAFDKS